MLISALISLLIFVLVAAVVWYCISLIPLPPPFGQIVTVVFLLICVLVLLSFLLPMLGVGYGYGYHRIV